MAISIKIPYLNPIRFFSETTEDFFYNSLKDWEYKKGYCQKYCFGDNPGLQFITHYTGLWSGASIYLVDINNTTIDQWYLFNTESAYGGTIYRWFSGFGTYTEGVYFLRVKLANDTGALCSFLSEPILLAATHENTVKIIYKHDLNDFDCLFFVLGGTYYPGFMMRIEGGVKLDGVSPGGNYTMFQNLDLNPVMLNSTPNTVFRFTFGNNQGIPNYLADKLNRIFSLSTVTIDGVGYARAEGAKLEASGRDQVYPLNIWTVDLVQSENLYSAGYDIQPTPPATIYLTADSTLYTADNAVLTADQTHI